MYWSIFIVDYPLPDLRLHLLILFWFACSLLAYFILISFLPASFYPLIWRERSAGEMPQIDSRHFVSATDA